MSQDEFLHSYQHCPTCTCDKSIQHQNIVEKETSVVNGLAAAERSRSSEEMIMTWDKTTSSITLSEDIVQNSYNSDEEPSSKKPRLAVATLLLPGEILELIFRMLSWRDLSSVVQVCRMWREVGEMPGLWRGLHVNPVMASSSDSLLAPLRKGLDLEVLDPAKLLNIIGTQRSIEHLESFSISGLDFDKRTLRSYFSSVVKMKKLKELSMRDTDLSIVQASVLANLVKKLHIFDISGCTVNKEQSRAIFKVLSENSAVKHLDISYNSLSCVDPRIFAKAINLLQSVDISDCDITEAQREELFKKMCEKTELKKLLMDQWNSVTDKEVFGAAINQLEVFRSERQGQLTTSLPFQELFQHMAASTKLRVLQLCYYGGDGLASVRPSILASAVSKLEEINFGCLELSSAQAIAVLGRIASKDSRLKKLTIRNTNFSKVDAELLAEAVTMVEVVFEEGIRITKEQILAILKKIEKVNRDISEDDIKTLASRAVTVGESSWNRSLVWTVEDNDELLLSDTYYLSNNDDGIITIDD